MRDLKNNIAIRQATAPAVLTATATSAAIDLAGFNTATVVVSTGAIAGAGNFTTKITECDTSDGVYTDVEADDLIGSLPAVLEAASVVTQGYKGGKRFIKTVTTLNSGTSIAAGVSVILGSPASAPAE